MNKIYTQKFKCAICRKIIGEYAESNRERTIKSWFSVCMSCWRNIEKRIERLEKYAKII